MGFFSSARKRIKKLIPKEVRPFVPYMAAMIPGGMGLSGGLAKFGGSQFLKAALAKGLTDDEADLKDIARTGIFAAAPTALGEYGGSDLMGGKSFLGEGATKAADYAQAHKFQTLAAQGGIDAGIKAAELNEDALARYNADLARQGINDKAGRRAAIRAIYSGTGTWDMDEVDSMLDTYGYRSGGRVGYEDGGSSDDGYVTIAKRKSKKKKSMDDEDYEEYEDSLKYAKEGYDMLYPEIENQPIRVLKLAEGGPVDALMERIKELQDEGLDFAAAMAQAQKEMKAQNKYSGGILDVNENINIETPRGDVDLDVNSMESIKGQTAGPDWYIQRIDHLLYNFPELSEEEAAEIAYDTSKYEEYVGSSDYARGGRVGFAEGDSVLTERSMVTPEQQNQIEGNQIAEDAYNKIMREFSERFPGIATGEETLAEMIAMLQSDRVLETENLGILGLDRSMDMITPESARRSAQRIMRGDTRFGSPEFNMGGRVGLESGGGIMQVSADMDIPIQDLAEDFEITFGRPAESLEELKDYYRRKYEFNGDTSDAGNNGVGNMAMTGDREWIIDSSRDNFANDMFGKDYDDLSPDEVEEIDIIIEMELGKNQAAPERTMAAGGGLMNLGGREMDLRGGGFVPMGAKERADDVPARLSKNEFVMTADAVRAAGGGSIQKGADLMHDQMKQLEAQA